MFLKKADSSSINFNQRPVYLVGNTPLIYFLGARLVQNKERVIFIGKHETISWLTATGITLKENRNLQKQNFKFETCGWIKESPKFTIISCFSSQLNSTIASLSSTKLIGSPIINFSLTAYPEVLSGILQTDIISGYFDGYLNKNENQITILGNQPSIIFNIDENSEFAKNLNNTFNNSGYKLIFNSSSSEFLNFFIPYAVGNLLCAYYHRSIFEIIKNKEIRTDLETLSQELCALYSTPQETILAEDIIKKMYTIPQQYIFPLQNITLSKIDTEFKAISSLLSSKIATSPRSCPLTSKILSSLYNLILA